MRGAGWGHGIGMSQWGAYGYAKHGVELPRDPRPLLPGHAASDRVTAGSCACCCSRTAPTVYFRDATQAGDRELDEDSVYRRRATGDNVVLRSSTGRKLEHLRRT